MYGLGTSLIKNIIQIEKDLFLVIKQSNLNPSVPVKKLNAEIVTTFKSKASLINYNVAIASAVTAYARIFMMFFKLNPAVVYSDTDSIFTSDPEPFKDITSAKLGDFKDELNGLVIEEGCFLGIKQYGYWYFNFSIQR